MILHLQNHKNTYFRNFEQNHEENAEAIFVKLIMAYLVLFLSNIIKFSIVLKHPIDKQK